MTITPGTEPTLEAAAQWRDRCLLEDGSVFAEERLWTKENIQEAITNFVERPDEGDRGFLAKLEDQLAPTSPGATQLVAEMLWVLFLFPSNVGQNKKIEIVSTVWGWSGATLPSNHPMFNALGRGIGSGGMGFNNYRPFELQFLILFTQAWKSKPIVEQQTLSKSPWLFAEFTDSVEGADRRQFRHMLLHLLFPDTFERVASKSDKTQIDAGFRELLASVTLTPEETSTTAIARDRRLARIIRLLRQQNPGEWVDFYKRPFVEKWRPDDTQKGTNGSPPRAAHVSENKRSTEPDDQNEQELPNLSTIGEAIRAAGLRISDRTLRRYHLALHSRGFVILSGISGSGKTWLAEEYAKAAKARYLVVPVAPNWTTNEDLLGFADPLSGQYRDTPFSRFLREAAAEHLEASSKGRQARDFYVILDEMNLARVEYYFATFLSKMELRIREGTSRIDLGSDSVLLAPNLKFVGTVNVDETTHGFADKVYDRAQLIEIEAPRPALQEHLGAAPYASVLLQVWDAVATVAPFAFRVLDDIGEYVQKATSLSVPWEELIDELLLQKVLPKLRGTDPRVGDALHELETLTLDRFPLSHAKVHAMRSGFEQQGVASYFG